MSTSSSFKAEVLNGHLHITIEIPTDTCKACGVVRTPAVDLDHLRQLYDNLFPIQNVFRSGLQDGWKLVWHERQNVLVCGNCAAPLIKAELESKKKEEEATTEIRRKISLRAAG